MRLPLGRKVPGAPAAPARRAGEVSRVGKALLLVAALLLCGVPVALVAHPISYVPLITVVLALAASFAYLQILKRTFSLSEDGMRRSCERGESVGLSVTLSNGSILPHPRVVVSFYITDLFGEYDALRTMTVPLGPREVATFDFDANFTHLGRYAAGVDSVRLSDLFGLFSCTIPNAQRRQIVVRPRLFDLTDVDISEAEEESASMVKPITADGTDYASVREYRFGDPLKTVHWNLTARSATNIMYTRLFETYVTPSAAAIIDPFAPAGDREVLMSLFDGMMEGAASLSRFARAQGVECTIRYLGRGFEPASICLAGEEDADELILSACRIVPLSGGTGAQGAANQTGEAGSHRAETAHAGGCGPDRVPSADDIRRAASIPVELFLQEGCGSQGASNIAYITARLDEDILSALEDVAARRRQAMLMLVVPASLVGRPRSEFLAPLLQLAQAGIPYYVLESTELETRRVAS